MNYDNKRMPKAPPKKPIGKIRDAMMTGDITSPMPRMKRGASKKQNFGQIITGNYSSDK